MTWTTLEKDIARERIQSVAQSTWLGACLHLPSGCYRPLKIRQIYVLFIVVFIVGVAAMLNCFFTRYWTYRDVIRFVDVTCETLRAEMTHRNLTCSCGDGCRGRYGCLVVFTRFRTLQGHNVSAILFATDLDLAISRVDKSSGRVCFHVSDTCVSTLKARREIRDRRASIRCTYHPHCGNTVHEAARHLDTFRRVISRPGTRYSCLYDPDVPSDVIQYRDVDPEQTASLLIGAGVVAVVGLVGCILTAAVCGCSYVFACAPPSDVTREAEVRRVEMEAMKKKTKALNSSGCDQTGETEKL